MGSFFVFATWIGLSVLVGMLAGSRGRSVVGYALLALITSPLLGLIVVLVLADKRKEDAQRQKEQEEKAAAQQAHQETLRAIMQAGQPAVPAEAPPVVSVAEELEKLLKLRDAGVISEGEFIRLKLELLRPKTTV